MGNRTKNILVLIVSVLLLAPIIVIIIWLPFFPEYIPAHYSGNVVDRIGSKYELLLFPLINIILLIIFSVTFLLLKRNSAEKINNKVFLTFYIINIVSYLAFDILSIYFTAKAYRLVNSRIEVNFYQIVSLIGAFVFLL